MAAVDKDGTEHVATDRHSERCTGTNARGLPCGAWALRGQEVCLRHSMTDAEWRAFATRGGKGRGKQRRVHAGLRDSSRHRHAVPAHLLGRTIDVVGGLLDAVIPDGSNEPNMEARGIGVFALAALFGITGRDELIELLGKVRPALLNDPQRERLLNLERARQALLRAVEEGRIDVSELPPGVRELDLAAV
jgi:hypothetical protein